MESFIFNISCGFENFVMEFLLELIFAGSNLSFIVQQKIFSCILIRVGIIPFCQLFSVAETDYIHNGKCNAIHQQHYIWIIS